MDLSAKQRLDAAGLVDEQPWGDMEAQMGDVEAALERALQATAGEFALWEEEGEDRYPDEFSVTEEEIDAMSPEWRLAYVGRLVRSLALAYGVPTGDFGDQPKLRDAEPHSPGGLLRALNDLTAMPPRPDSRG